MKKAKFDFDLVVIGSGAAGSAGAMYAAGAGLKVAVIEKGRFGGAALNRADVPYAALLSATHLFSKAVEGAKFGLTSDNLRLNYSILSHWKSVAMRRAGADDKGALTEADVTCVQGKARFLSQNEIIVEGLKGETQKISAERFLVATGSRAIDPGIAGAANAGVLTPEAVLALSQVPKTVFVVGGGATGCEIAQYFAEVGAKVVIAEIAGRLLPKEDEEAGLIMGKIFAKRNKISALVGTRVTKIERETTGGKKVSFMSNGRERAVRVDAVVLATGEAADVRDLDLEKAGVEVGKSGVLVDATMGTSRKNIFAAGEATGEIGSIEIATYQARLAVINMLHRQQAEANYVGFARVVRTYPEVASVGLSEDECIRQARKYKKALTPLSAVSASNIFDFSDGFVKVITDLNGRVIGATVVAPEAGILIQEAALAIRSGLMVQDVAETPHSMLAFSEAVKIAMRKVGK
jgi:dihydrolipoamide dehydrogenase